MGSSHTLASFPSLTGMIGDNTLLLKDEKKKERIHCNYIMYFTTRVAGKDSLERANKG